MNRLISVIVPVYNAESFLKRCLESLVNQTYKNIEIICINDKSADNSSAVLKEYSLKDERIKLFENPKNIGAALSRNLGIKQAKGEYIYFIDSDDYIDEKYLEVMVQKSEQINSDIILNLSILTDTNGNETVYKHPSMPEINKDGQYSDKISIIHNAPCFIWSRLYRKSFLDKIKLKFFNIKVAEDVAFNTLSTIQTDNNYIFWGEKYHYSVTKCSLIGRTTDRDSEHIKAYSLIYDYLKEHNISDDRLKLFRVYPFFKVDTQQKFDCYKEFFEKIKDDFIKCENIYNDLEKYFAYSVLNSQSYEDYLKNYSPVVTIGFLRRKK